MSLFYTPLTVDDVMTADCISNTCYPVCTRNIRDSRFEVIFEIIISNLEYYLEYCLCVPEIFEVIFEVIFEIRDYNLEYYLEFRISKISGTHWYEAFPVLVLTIPEWLLLSASWGSQLQSFWELCSFLVSVALNYVSSTILPIFLADSSERNHLEICNIIKDVLDSVKPPLACGDCKHEESTNHHSNNCQSQLTLSELWRHSQRYDLFNYLSVTTLMRVNWPCNNCLRLFFYLYLLNN